MSKPDSADGSRPSNQGASIEAPTPLVNRLVFGVFALILAAAMVKVFTWAIAKGGRPMPLALCLLFFGTAIIGLVLTTFKADIRLRVHRIWTPMWILFIAWGWYFALVIALPKSSDPADLLFRRTAETPIWTTGFGLMVAFTDTKAIRRYAFWFIPYCLIMLAELIALSVAVPIAVVSEGFHPAARQINDWNDLLACYSGVLFGSYIVAKARAQWPGWRTAAKCVGIAVAAVVALFFLTQFIGQRFPADSVIRQWLSPN